MYFAFQVQPGIQAFPASAPASDSIVLPDGTGNMSPDEKLLNVHKIASKIRV